MIKQLGIKGSSIFFWGAMACAVAAVAVAASGIGHAQNICRTEGLEGILADMHPALAEGARGKAAIVPFKCSSFQLAQWWTFASQCWFMLFAVLVVLLKKVPVYKMAVIGTGFLATAQASVVDWTLVEAGGGVFGDLYQASLRTFWGFFTLAIVNPCIIYALCDMDWALTQQRKQQKAAARAAAVLNETYSESNESDSLKPSASGVPELPGMV